MIRIIYTLALVWFSSTSLFALTNGYWSYYIAPWNGGAHIFGYTGPSGIVNVPDQLDGNPVYGMGGLGNFVFTNATVTSLNIGTNLSEIFPYVISNQTNLININVDIKNTNISSVDGVLFSRSNYTYLLIREQNQVFLI
jgi:hypothetical protein